MISDALPVAAEGLTDEELLDRYAVPASARSWVRFGFIATADGAATLAGRSGGLGNAADRRMLALLRRPADVLLVGAGTIRAEGYSGELLDEGARRWRTEHGLPARPVVAVVSGTLDLDPGAPFFTDAPRRPIVFTSASVPEERRRALAPVADVLQAGAERVEPAVLVSVLEAMRLRLIHSEGGPALFGSFLAAGLVDDLCLSLSPMLVGGGLRLLPAPLPAPARLRLEHVLESEGLLLLRYTLGRASS